MMKKMGILWLACVAFAGFGSKASAFSYDPSIAIQRTQNSPIITVQFKETRARLVELRINGKSVATRSVKGGSAIGEMQFHVDMSSLEEGRNEVEVRLFSENGELLGTERDVIEILDETTSAVSVTFPKQGQTIQGLVEIKMGMARSFAKPFVSFMIDGEWKAVRNYEPYTYIWDTEAIGNGWHEVQIWVVGEDNVTLKSRKVRVFVDNPGGRTNRTVPSTVTHAATTAVPAPSLNLAAMSGTITGKLGQRSKPVITVKGLSSVTTGTRMLTPTGKRLIAPKAATVKPTVTSKPVVAPKTLPSVSTKPATAAPATPVEAPTIVKPATAPMPTISVKPTVAPKVTPVNTTATTIALTKGTRLPNLSSLSITYNAAPVKFDVAPRVMDGVAVTPFRHLFEHAGGKVKWEHNSKTVSASGLKDITLKIGSNRAVVNGVGVTMEKTAAILKNRTIVPLTFIGVALDVTIDVDPSTGHVLIRKKD